MAKFGFTEGDVSCIGFNNFGDKLGACDTLGNFLMYNFDLRTFVPMLTLESFKRNQALAFSFINSGSVVAKTGLKPKPFLTVYDTLMP